MLKLTLEDGGILDIPSEAISMVEETEAKGCSIVYSLQQGQNESEILSDKYGFVKKKWLDSNPQAGSAVEVTIAAESPRKLTIMDQSIIARREIKDGEFGAKLRLTLAIGPAIFSINVKDKRETLANDE